MCDVQSNLRDGPDLQAELHEFCDVLGRQASAPQHVCQRHLSKDITE
jgi:hypothetical protein